MSPSAIIAEDEALLAERLRALLQRSWPELRVVALAHNGIEALEAVMRERPDVVFLDIRMPGMTGLEVAAEIVDRLAEADKAPQIVFATAHGEFALEAFELAAVDYLLKPISEARLAQCVERLQARMPQRTSADELAIQLRRMLGASAVAAPPNEPLRIIRAGLGDTVTMIPLEDVCYFQASDKYTSVMTEKGESLIRTPLKELLTQLPPARFAQIHRAIIVNLDEVASSTRDAGGRVALTLRRRPEVLSVSRMHADLFRQM